MPPPPASDRRRNRLTAAAVALLLTFQYALAVDTARRLSVTHDEYWHLPAGFLTLRTGRFDYDNLNPPLPRVWAALPLLIAGAETGEAKPSGPAAALGETFLTANAERYHTLYTLARGVHALWLPLGGGLLAFWAWRLFDRTTAAAAAVVWSCSPNLLAHGALVTGDLPAAVAFLATLFLLWRFAERPTWSRAALFGTVLGAAQLVKFTCVLLFPLCLVVWWVIRTRFAGPTRAKTLTPGPSPKGRGEKVNETSSEIGPTVGRIKLVMQWLAAVLLSTAVLHAGYLFRGSRQPLASYRFSSRALAGVQQRLPGWLQRAPVFLPRDYLEGLDAQRSIMEQPHPVFLDASWSTDGFPTYYLACLNYKLPHALQLLFLLACLRLLFRRGGPRRGHIQLTLLIPALGLLAVASFSGMQLGIRYVLPVLPCMILFAAQGAAWCSRSTVGVAVLLVLAAALLGSLRYHPHHLAYFNELAGGPTGGRWHLVDSNLDWGQDLDALARWLDDNRIPEVRLAYFGTVPPAAAGIRYALPAPRPEPGAYAISVNFVQGRPHVLRAADGSSRAVGLDEFGYFRFFEPHARIGHSIDVYMLTAGEVARFDKRAGMTGAR